MVFAEDAFFADEVDCVVQPAAFVFVFVEFPQAAAHVAVRISAAFASDAFYAADQNIDLVCLCQPDQSGLHGFVLGEKLGGGLGEDQQVPAAPGL